VRNDLPEVIGSEDSNPGRTTGSAEACRRNDGFGGTDIANGENRSQGSAGCAESTVESELSDEGAPVNRFGWERFARREDADGNREVEARTALSKFCWCEIDGDATIGKGQARGRDCASDSRDAFAHRGFR
jgi:hypothetical protein